MNGTAAPRASRREIGIATAILLLVGVLLYGPHVLNGGFTIDDWGHAAAAKYFRDGILETYWVVTPNRPVLVLYVPFTYILFGTHEWIHLAWSLLLAVGMSTALYALLRRLSVEALHAGAIAVLLLLFPWSDAARFWATASHIDLGIALGIGGVLLALRGLDELAAGRVRRERFLHAGAVALYALSVLTYEIAGVVLLFAGALYLTRAPWRVTRLRWALDAAVVAACLAWTAVKSNRVRPSLEQMLEHAEELAGGAATVFARASMPFGTVDGRTAVGLLAVVALAGLIVWAVLDSDDAAKPGLRRWLTIFGSGLLVALAGWILYIPADPYYQFDAAGVGNRTNVMAAVGVIVVVYSALVLVATLVVLGMRSWRRSSLVLCALLGLILAFGYARVIHDDQRAWAQASEDAEQMLTNVKTALPHPPPESTIYTFNYPGSYADGVVIFAFSWDLNGAIKLAYDDPTLIGYPILEGTEMRCGPTGVGPVGPEWSESQSTPYGQAFLVDVTRMKAVRIKSPRQCAESVDGFVPGPSIKPSEPAAS